MQRQLKFDDLDQAVAESESLLQTGYRKTGKWSLAQICCHMRLTIENNIHGYPRWMVVLGYPLRPVLRWFGLPRILSGNSPKGLPTAGRFIPSDDLEDAQEVERFKQCVALFLENEEPLFAHPGFGKMSKEEFNQFHAAHAAHHLRFLIPEEND